MKPNDKGVKEKGNESKPVDKGAKEKGNESKPVDKGAKEKENESKPVDKGAKEKENESKPVDKGASEGKFPKQKAKRTTTKWYDKKLIKLSLKGLGGIILGVIIGCSSSALTQWFQNNEKIISQQSVANNLCIGTNEEYANSVLGYPFLKSINEKTNMTDCFYKIDGAIVRLFFENNSAKGIFITITDKRSIGRFIFENYSWTTKEKKLGTFTFEEIDADNEGNYSQFSNGIGTFFYLEKYYLGNFGGYYDHFFAILPYGIFFVPSDTNKNEEEHCHWEAGQMGGDFPNTIGIVDFDYTEKVCAMILDIERFDYHSMNIYLKEMWDYYDSLPEEDDDIEEDDDQADDNNTSIYKPTYFEECLQKYLDEVYDKDLNNEGYSNESYSDENYNSDVININEEP